MVVRIFAGSCFETSAANLIPDPRDAQVPKLIEFVDALPRNAMGKVNKKAILREFFADDA